MELARGRQSGIQRYRCIKCGRHLSDGYCVGHHSVQQIEQQPFKPRSKRSLTKARNLM
jgi:hypothetical protein